VGKETKQKGAKTKDKAKDITSCGD